MHKRGSSIQKISRFFLLIVFLTINFADMRSSYSQTQDNSDGKLISVSKFYGGERREYEDSIEYEYSKDDPGYNRDVVYDSLSCLGPFPGLTEMEFTGGSIFYNLELAEPISKMNRIYNTRDPAAANAKIIDEGPVLIRSRLSPESEDIFEISFKWGPGSTNNFNIKKIGGRRTEPAFFHGDKMYIPGNGYIYVEGHVNSAFNHRRKYRWEDGRFWEAPQAAYYVGLKTYITAPLKLYRDTTYTEVVASLSENQPVEVLIVGNSWKKNDFLLKTPFGLTGWVRIDETYPRTALEGIFYKID